MAINPVQLNMDKFQANLSFGQKKDYKSYLEATGTVSTGNNVKPLPPQGHLVDDNLVSGTKYFFKDIAYDMKSVKNGYKGTANDHQLGRLNDVGLKLGGIGIATYLASRTTNAKARIMEYVGLATFLTAMSIYPKIAINAPAKLVHGYDIDKEYIDDQGRKKSVQQDSNYVPYDMYQGQRKDEDLDAIGDKMGIPRNIKNRHDVIKEQMRKIATQNNTLWMLTAGFATPLMTALICCGLENYVVAPAVAKNKNNKADKQISEILGKLKTMASEGSTPQESKVSKTVAEIIKDYKNQELPKEEFENIVKIITDGLTGSTADVVKEELNTLLNPQADKKPDIAKVSEKVFARFRRNPNVKNNLNISTEEFNEALAKAKSMSSDTSKLETNFRMTLKEVFDKKITAANLSGAELHTHQTAANSLIQELSAGVEKVNGSVITESTISKLNEFAKIIGEFKEKKVLLDSIENFKFEFAPETILARSSAKFERILLKDLGIKYKDLKKMRDSASYTEQILNERLTLLSKNDTKFKKLMKDLADVFCENESNLNGASKDSPVMKELINSYEYLFNGTAKRLKALGGFDKTIARLIGENPDSADLWITSNEELVKFLDGTAKSIKEGDPYKMIEKFSRGLGSDKYNVIERIFARYQNCTNGFKKVMHAADAYRRIFYDKTLLNSLSSKNPEYVKEVINKCTEVLLNGDPAAHFNKLHITEDSALYRDIMKVLYAIDNDSKAIVSDLTDDVLKGYKEGNWNFFERFKDYIIKFRAIIGNDKTDFTKPDHNLRQAADYSRMAQTNKAKADLIGEKLTEAVRKAAGRKYSTQKWVRIVGGALSGVFGATLLTQFCFGKIRNPHNLKKQVNNESN